MKMIFVFLAVSIFSIFANAAATDVVSCKTSLFPGEPVLELKVVKEGDRLFAQEGQIGTDYVGDKELVSFYEGSVNADLLPKKTESFDLQKFTLLEFFVFYAKYFSVDVSDVAFAKVYYIGENNIQEIKEKSGKSSLLFILQAFDKNQESLGSIYMIGDMPVACR